MQTQSYAVEYLQNKKLMLWL